ncbi:MAG TPA: histidine kinase dimerization/phospho-acceptor domain-containing protein [Spirochaetota bacterium]|nr:histidine kinase dimerization/phospho-acceptor domain-containing protein [Spirochaetota bacterium]
MENKRNSDENYEIFGKAIPQLIHDIRNPLNIIIGFSSIIQMDENFNEETKSYLKKIYQAGLSIEQMLSNIDIYIMGIDELQKDYFYLNEELDAFLKSKEDIIAEKNIYIKNLSTEKYKVNFSPDLFKRILENIFYFSLKGFRNSKIKEIFILIKKERDILTIYYGDSSDIISIGNDYFTIEEILNNKRGLGLIFLEKFIKYANGNIKYLHGNNWSNVVKDLNIKTEHGFIIEIPMEFVD